MKKKIFTAFGLGILVGSVVMYFFKEKELETIREIFDDENFEDYEYEEEYFDEEIAKDFDAN